MNIKAQTFCLKADGAARLMKSLANAHRLMILCRLHEGEASVGDIEKAVPLAQSALSQHLARLRREGIVRTRRQAQTVRYSLVKGPAVAIIRQLYGLYCGSSPNEGKRRKRHDA